jgi:hypothetical protein
MLLRSIPRNIWIGVFDTKSCNCSKFSYEKYDAIAQYLLNINIAFILLCNLQKDAVN